MSVNEAMAAQSASGALFATHLAAATPAQTTSSKRWPAMSR
jgi:hypothetical protein